jgi:hypothetical protein
MMNLTGLKLSNVVLALSLSASAQAVDAALTQISLCGIFQTQQKIRQKKTQ